MNKEFVTKLVVFTTGAIIGSVATWLYVKDKYKKIADEEIASVKEVLGRNHPKEDSEEMEPEDISLEEKMAKIRTAEAIVNRYNYATQKPKEEKPMFDDAPYMISPDEFGEIEDYNTVSLTYYADGVLTDEDDEPLDDAEDLVGEDYVDHFGEHDDIGVFVRNDALRTDYEILYNPRNYSDL